jgi:hypothetical protein
MLPLRQRLSLIANQARAEETHFVEHAIREAMDSLAAYDARVTDLLQANSKLVAARRKAQAETDQYFMLLWLLVNKTGTKTIERSDVTAFPMHRAELVIETNKASKDVVIIARTKPAETQGAA